MSGISDFELAERWNAGDRRSGDELVSRYFDQIRGYFINAVGEREHLDLLQETFMQLTKSLSSFAATSSFRTFLFAIARHVRINFYRRHFKLKETFDSGSTSVEDIDGVTPSTAVAMLEAGQRLNACVRRLAIDDREMVELFYWHGWQATEIAELFEVQDATVRTRLRRARENIRNCIGGTTEELSRDEVSKELEEQLRLLGRELGIPGARRAT